MSGFPFPVIASRSTSGQDPEEIELESTPELLALHAIRLKGFANDAEVASRFGLTDELAAELMLDFQAMGWVTKVEFAGTGGWTLNAAGRTENERQLAQELAETHAAKSIRAGYTQFLGHNARLLQACTDWQLRPSASDPLAANDHSDHAWDGRVISELAALCSELRALSTHFTLNRFHGYDQRFAAALARAEQGDGSWVNRPRVDSCHTVWMELHEDLLATLGIQRGTEA